MATKQQATVVANESSGQWAGNVATGTLNREAQARRARDDARTGAAQLHESASREGYTWLQRTAAALSDAADAFNARAGVAVVRVSQLPSGVVDLTVARDRQFLQLAPDWRADDGRYVPGLVVTINNGRESRRPFRFALVDDVLMLAVDGVTFTPEGLVRHLAESFLSALTLNGR